MREQMNNYTENLIVAKFTKMLLKLTILVNQAILTELLWSECVSRIFECGAISHQAKQTGGTFLVYKHRIKDDVINLDSEAKFDEQANNNYQQHESEVQNIF